MGNPLSYIFRLITEYTCTGTLIASQKYYAIIKDSINAKFALSKHEMNSLPIGQQKRILSSVLNLNYDFTSEQNFFEKNGVLLLLLPSLILMRYVVYIFKEKIPFLTRAAQRRPNPFESSACNQSQLLSQSMAGVNRGDQSTPHRPFTRSQSRSHGNSNLLNSSNNSRSN